jgi:hypothetical protein
MKLDNLDRRIQSLEARGHHPKANPQHPYWINEDEPYEQRMARYRAYFEALE